VQWFVVAMFSEYGISPEAEGSDAETLEFGKGASSGKIHLVAETDATVVGSVSLTPFRTDMRLSMLYVVPEMRRKGVARRLVNRAIDEARAADWRCIEINMREHHREALSLCEQGGWERGASKRGSGADHVYYLPLQTA
jgi:GNAT superfamily N-acetyltransferase